MKQIIEDYIPTWADSLAAQQWRHEERKSRVQTSATLALDARHRRDQSARLWHLGTPEAEVVS